MEPYEVSRAIAAATEVATSVGLRATHAIVLHNSNKLALRLTPCDVLARVSAARDDGARLELDRARRLAAAGCPVGVADPRVDPLVHPRHGFDVTLWTYYEPVTPRLSAPDYAKALARLHTGMTSADLPSPRFTDRIAEAQLVADDPSLSPELADADRLVLSRALQSARRAVLAYDAVEQLLHGEPHPGNVLTTTVGPLFVDFETICRGPVEFDLAHAPEAVCEHYPRSNPKLLDDCRHLVLAMVAAWRWQVGDEFPNRRQWGQELLSALRLGPPWPTLDAMTQRLDPSENAAGR